NPNAQVVEEVRNQYKQQSVSILGRRYKARILPKLRVSFPVSDNHVMYVAYSHNMRLPHPRFVYAGLDPVYQDKSDLSDLGNPNLNPEVSVNYEIGLKSKLGAYTSAQLTAFYNDRFDYIVQRSIEVQDQTGRYVTKSFYINQDYARTRGIELTVFQRIHKVLYITLGGSYQLITGKSNAANEQAIQIKTQGYVSQTREYPGASDTPFNLKFSTTYTPDTNTRLFGIVPLKGFKFYFGAYFRTGIRYTPMHQSGTNALGRPIYEADLDKPLSKIGSPIFNADIRISRDFKILKQFMVTLSFEVKNLFDNKNAQIINPVTGNAYYNGDALPNDMRDPKYNDPQDNGTPPFDPSRFQAPRQVLFGVAFGF
ncbi:MAG: TonB-dependent receptor, partial [Cytophagales bacterium]|nr:TonB-dependent receptor [Cytophagales bacterium]